uniref:ATP synthase subunit a n=1 Tax=Eurytoma sp. TJS-2016 TaxID=1855182 RepID=A0A1X9HXH1_9HYME|nr:ATP synthase F0 subunit 6 [Eurytoma sp. TJS-2016]
MMMNLFSIFDPSTSMNFSINWFSCMYLLLYLPLSFWFIPSRWNMFTMKIMFFLLSEMSVLLVKKENKMNLLIYISMFFFIILNNFLGLFSYIFTSTSHLTISLSMSLPLWVSFMIYGWINFSNHMFIHLVPSGTPSVLMPFMVLIETISNIIRPGTLAVRLTANMIAGHLLMTLISSTGSNLNLILLIFMLLSQMMLIMLELSVAFIQAYVFTILSTLYSSEVNYEKIISTLSFSNFKSMTFIDFI